MKFVQQLQTKYVECACSSLEHSVRFCYYKDEPDTLYITVHLNKLSFFERLILAVKYVFGYQSKYGCTEETILGPPEINNLYNILTQYSEDYNKWIDSGGYKNRQVDVKNVDLSH